MVSNCRASDSQQRATLRLVSRTESFGLLFARPMASCANFMQQAVRSSAVRAAKSAVMFVSPRRCSEAQRGDFRKLALLSTGLVSEAAPQILTPPRALVR